MLKAYLAKLRLGVDIPGVLEGEPHACVKWKWSERDKNTNGDLVIAY